MELGDLHIFKTVADEGGIIKAARKLHRVQSSVSTRITQLESSIGTQLFHRDSRRLTLSPAGERLLAYADRLLRLSERRVARCRDPLPAGSSGWARWRALQRAACRGSSRVITELILQFRYGSPPGRMMD